MDTLQQTLQKQLSDLPRQFLPELLDKKLREHGVKLSKRKLAELAGKLLNDKVESFDFATRAGADRRISIEFTDADMKWIEEQCEQALEGLPDLIQTLSQRISSELLKTLKRLARGIQPAAARNRRISEAIAEALGHRTQHAAYATRDCERIRRRHQPRDPRIW
jgi:hypothetical protein